MKRVLTVDDSKVVRSMVARHLAPYGCEVIEAANGQQGVEEARQHKPDLILLDITMPVMDGRQALAELRKDAATKAIPVIMLTAESGKDMVVEVVKLGVTGYIIKPFQKEAFDKEVGKVLGAPGAGAADAPPVDQHRVLVVDDSERVLEAARDALGKSLEVLTATSGKEALARYRETRPGIVVIDLAMPDMDGFETLKQLRDLGKSIFVALAVGGDGGVAEKARQAGYHAIVTKPFQADDLRDQVLGALTAGATPEDLLKAVFDQAKDLWVLTLPDPRSKLFARVMPVVGKKLRAMAEDGDGKLIVDLGNVSGVSTDVVTHLVRIVAEATAVGIKTAICSADDAVTASLRQIAEIQSTPCAASRDAARESLGA